MEDLLFDINKSTEIIGSKKMVTKLLDKLLDELAITKKTIKKCSELNDTQQLKKIIHKTLGATAYCITPKLTKQLNELQKKIKEDTSQLNNDCLKIITTINLMLNTLKNHD